MRLQKLTATGVAAMTAGALLAGPAAASASRPSWGKNCENKHSGAACFFARGSSKVKWYRYGTSNTKGWANKAWNAGHKLSGADHAWIRFRLWTEHGYKHYWLCLPRHHGGYFAVNVQGHSVQVRVDKLRWSGSTYSGMKCSRHTGL